MTATTHSIVQRKPSQWSTERKKGGYAEFSSAEQTSLGSAADVRAALDICGVAEKRVHTVSSTSIGKASHVDAT